jgi:hypothetical protein
VSDDVPPIVQQQRKVFAWVREQIMRASPDTSPMNWDISEAEMQEFLNKLERMLETEEVLRMSKDYCAQESAGRPPAGLLEQLIVFPVGVAQRPGLHLDPRLAWARPVERILPLRDHALESQPLTLGEQRVSIGKRLRMPQPRPPVFIEKARQTALAVNQRQPPQIPAVHLQQVEAPHI